MASSTVYANVASLPQNTVAQRILDQHGLCAYTVTWEDTARDHNSAYGPNISDMTLIANGADMPVIRRPNFSDLTFKVSHALVTFTVGNELGEAKREITLKEFLMNPAHYLHEPLKYESDKPLWVDGADETVVMSAQACLLPVPLEDGKKTTFTPALRNHQSRKGAPAVLVIMATDEGTSVRVINTNRVEKLYFNLDGQRCPLKAMRLGAFRRAQGRPDDGSPMNAEERAKNRIMIVQVPLLVDFFKTSFSPATGKSNHPSVSFSGFAPSPFAPPPSSTHFTFGGSPPPPPKVKEESPESDDMGFDLFGDHPNDGAEVWTSDDPPPTPTPKVEHAIVSVGEPEGEYNELCGQKIVRDKRWPIRVTLQYYHATTTGTLDEALAQLIDQQLREAQAHYMAISVGSLVLHSVKPKLDTPPAWWPTFAQLHWEGELHKYYHSKEEAAAILFKNGRFTKEGMSRVADKALEILRKNATKK